MVESNDSDLLSWREEFFNVVVREGIHFFMLHKKDVNNDL
jgi:hypothetical protein